MLANEAVRVAKMAAVAKMVEGLVEKAAYQAGEEFWVDWVADWAVVEVGAALQRVADAAETVGSLVEAAKVAGKRPIVPRLRFWPIACSCTQKDSAGVDLFGSS
jgi:hypothetical protein